MDELQLILDEQDLNKRIKRLMSGRQKPLPDVPAIQKEWNVYLHRTIADKCYLPDRVVEKDGVETTQSVNRIAVPLQKRIVNTAVSFAFGNPVELQAEVKEGSDNELVFNAVKKLSHECKLKSVNRRMFRELMRSTEVAELWHHIKDPAGKHNIYGFETEFKIRVALFSPFAGDELYPYFDDTNDLIAFSRLFKRLEGGKTKKYFEVYTAEHYYIYSRTGAAWAQVEEPKENPFGKIPISFTTQEAVEWADVQICIERLEFLLSKFAETNDYHASPKIFVQGKIKSFVQKNDSGGIIEGEKGATAEYLSWANAPESVKLEIETKLRFIYSMTQTPDISFDSVKGLHQISGISLKMLFMDAHLKVQEKREILDDYLQRRVNIQKRMIGFLSNKKKIADNLEIVPEIIPYIIDDTTTLIENLSTATGGKPIMSQRTAIKMLGWVDNIDEELEQIEKEEAQRNKSDAFETAF